MLFSRDLTRLTQELEASPGVKNSAGNPRECGDLVRRMAGPLVAYVGL